MTEGLIFGKLGIVEIAEFPVLIQIRPDMQPALVAGFVCLGAWFLHQKVDDHGPRLAPASCRLIHKTILVTRNVRFRTDGLSARMSDQSSLCRFSVPLSRTDLYQQDGELSAAIELRRRFPGIIDNAKARECARAIAGWTPRPEPPAKVVKLRPRRKA